MALIEFGYDPATPDGQVAYNTRNAIRGFQKTRGFEETETARVSGLVIGPEGTLRGSHVIAKGGRYAPSSTAGIAAATVARSAVPEAAAFFLVGDRLKLAHVE